MKRFGTLVKEAPFPVWETPAGNTVSLSQFRDNVNVGAKGPSACDKMSRVCVMPWPSVGICLFTVTASAGAISAMGPA